MKTTSLALAALLATTACANFGDATLSSTGIGVGGPTRIPKVATTSDRFPAIYALSETYRKYAVTDVAYLPTGEVTYTGRVGIELGNAEGEAVGDFALTVNFDTDAVTGEVTNINLKYSEVPWQKFTRSVPLTGTHDSAGNITAAGTGTLYGANKYNIAVDIDMLLELVGALHTASLYSAEGNDIHGTVTGEITGDLTTLVEGVFFGDGDQIDPTPPCLTCPTIQEVSGTDWDEAGDEASTISGATATLEAEMPTTGSARYSGQVGLNLIAFRMDGEAIGDLEVLILFDSESLQGEISDVKLYLDSSSSAVASFPEQLTSGVLDVGGDTDGTDIQLEIDGELVAIDENGQDFEIEIEEVLMEGAFHNVSSDADSFQGTTASGRGRVDGNRFYISGEFYGEK